MFSIDRQRRFAPLLAALLITSTSIATADGPHLSDVEIDSPAEIGDIASLLRVTKVSGSFQFDGTIKKVALVLEYYKQGKLVPSVPAIKTFMQPVQGGTKGKFSIQIADIDYLQLGDARKNHCRVQIEMGLKIECCRARLTFQSMNSISVKDSRASQLIGKKMPPQGDRYSCSSIEGQRYSIPIRSLPLRTIPKRTSSLDILNTRPLSDAWIDSKHGSRGTAIPNLTLAICVNQATSETYD